MTFNANLGRQDFSEVQVAAAGHGPHPISKAVLADQGSLQPGLILAGNAAGLLVPYKSETVDVGDGEAAATAVSAEVLGAGTGSVTLFEGYLDHLPVAGTFEVTATVSASPVTAAASAAGAVATDDVVGYVNLETGFFHLVFTVAPDNSSSVTADYSHTPPARSFSGAFTIGPIMPGSVQITDNASGTPQVVYDDGHGNLDGDGAGSIDYRTGEFTVTFDAAPAEGLGITATAVNKPLGVNAHLVDTANEGVALIFVHGTVRAGALLKMGATETEAAAAADLARLETLGIYPI